MNKIVKKIIAYILLICELFQTTGVYALTKEESVYVKLNEKGEVESTSVIEHLSNYNGNTINDKTILNNIKNINGNEKYSQEDNDLIWETNGSDIYYQGSYSKDLPVSLSVKYYLDGKEKNVNEMLGKKGNIKISLTYKNNAYKMMNINGQNEKIYVPYGIVTSTIISNTDNKNIKVTNGKIIDNGIGSVVMAVSLPGLYETLKVNDLKDLNNVEITYDTDSFELSSIYSVATTNLFDDINFNSLNAINDINSSIQVLHDSNIRDLLEKYQYYRNQDKNALKEQLLKIVEKNINNITPALEEEIAKETSIVIKENKDELENDLIFYTKKNTKEVIDEEVKRVVSKLDIDDLMGKVINTNLHDLLINDSEVNELSNLLKESINEKLNTIINEEFNKINDCISDNMSQSEYEKYVNDIALKYGVTYEQALGIVGDVRTDTLNQVKNNISEANIPNTIINSLNDKDFINNLVNSYINELNTKLKEILSNDSEILDYSNELKEKIISKINNEIDDNNISLNIDLKEYISKTTDKIIDNTARDVANKYTEKYTNEVVKNTIEKEFSEETIDSNLRELLDIYEDDINQKVTTLDNTINTLSNSFNKFNVVLGNVNSFKGKFDALMNLSDEYKTVDTSPVDANSNSKIIFMIDSISKPNDIESNNYKEKAKVSIWDKIKGLFK